MQALTREKEQEIRTVSNKNWMTQFTNYQIYQKLELGYGLLNSLGVEADDILEQKFGNKRQQEDAVHEQIRKITILMKLKMLLMKVLSLIK